MGFLRDLFSGEKKNSGADQSKIDQTATEKPLAPLAEPIPDSYTQAGLTCSVSQEEKELVSVITSAILAEEKPDSKFVLKSVVGIDEEKTVAGIIASAILSGDNPDSRFKLKSVTQI